MNKKLLIVRGHRLNKWEMQNYEPLKKYYDIKAVASYDHRFPLNEIEFPVKKLHSLRQIIGHLPKFRALFDLLTRNWPRRDYLLGLEKLMSTSDIVHTLETHAHYIFSYQAALSKQKYRYRLVITHWENIPFAYEDMPNNRKIKSFVHRAADHFLAITERAKEALIVEGVPENKISVVNYGIDLKRFFPKPKNERLMNDLELRPDDLVILFIGRFVWEKGIFEILYALKKIIQDLAHSGLPNMKCLIVGSGEEKASLTEMIARLNLTSEIRLLTDYPYQLIPEMHSLADIFIMPSVPLRHLREQYGMVLIEAMAMGKPIVSTYCGSIPEVVEDAGFLVPPADHFALSQAIDHLIRNPEARTEIGIKARQIAERKYDALKVSSKIHGIYQALLSK